MWPVDKDRTVIPRWRDLQVTLALGELGNTTSRNRVPHVDADALESRKRDWQANRTLSFAADFLSCAVALGRANDASEAAEFILERAPQNFDTLRKVAARVTSPAPLSDVRQLMTPPTSESTIRKEVHQLRQLTHDEPRNAFLWVDLARRYEILGIWHQASRMIEIALCLAPTNRFVLRSAARLYLHQEDIRRAHRILFSTKVVESDPWIAAAEIAIATAGNQPPRSVKFGRQMLESGKHGTFHISELASALATLEFAAGNTRRARKLIEASVITPSENSIAQLAWINRNINVVHVDAHYAQISSEAGAWESFRNCDWQGVLDGSSGWLRDQPFSSRPAILGSYTASVCMNRNEESLAFSKSGLIANPNDTMLLNNSAFALARMGRLIEAGETYGRIDPSRISEMEKTAYLATGGLLEIRAGRWEIGERLYREAIQFARSKNDRDTEALASLFFAIEQTIYEPMLGKVAIAEAIALLQKSQRPDLQFLSKRFAQK